MLEFFSELKSRNETMYYYGLVCLALSVLFLLLTTFTNKKVYNINAWIKPFKFAFSTFLFAWAMAWYCFYLSAFNISLFNWSVILLLGFEIVYIAFQASKGQLSHYNISTPLYSFLYSLMAIAATIVTLYTGYVAYLFFVNDFPSLPDYYLWAIRLGMIIFVIFSLEGFVMGSRLTHTIGGPDGGPGIPILNWSTKFGDPRVAHFIGMHALQVLPFLSFYLLKNTTLTIALSVLYALLALATLIQALKGKPVYRMADEQSEIIDIVNK